MIAVLLLLAATGVAVAGCFGVWAKRQALETGPWVDTSERLLKNQEIRDELGRELSGRVLAVPEVRSRLDSLSPAARKSIEDPGRRKPPQVLGAKPPLVAWRPTNRRP